MWGINAVDAYLAEFTKVLDAALGYLQPPIFGLYDSLMILGIAALSVFLLGGGRAYFDRLGPRVLYLGGMGFILDNFGTITQFIANSFVFLGLAGGGGAMAEYTFWHPGLLAQFGNEAAEPLRMEAARITSWDPASWEIALWYGVAAFLLKVSFYVMATAVFVAIVAFKLGVVAAFVLAAAAALPRFAWMASGGFGFVISAGVGLFSYSLIISVVNSVTATLFSGAEPATEATVSLAILTAVVNFGLVLLGPAMIRNVMSGVANMGLGAAATAAGAVAGVLAAPVAGGMAAARAAPALIQGAKAGAANAVRRLQDMRSGASRVPGAALNVGKATANLGGTAPKALNSAPEGWGAQKALPPPAMRGVSAIHTARALVPDGTDQGGGMMAPSNPERS